MSDFEVHPRCLRLEWISAMEGIRLVNLMIDNTEKLSSTELFELAAWEMAK